MIRFIHNFAARRRCAEHGFRSLKRSAEHGFTLIELMVVIAIIGLVSATVIFNLPDSRGNLLDEAESFAARAAAVRDEAIIGAHETRVLVNAQGYRFERRRRGEWLSFEQKPLRPLQWDEATRVGSLAIMFDPTGQASDSARLFMSRGDASVAVDFDVNGSVRVAG